MNYNYCESNSSWKYDDFKSKLNDREFKEATNIANMLRNKEKGIFTSVEEENRLGAVAAKNRFIWPMAIQINNKRWSEGRW